MIKSTFECARDNLIIRGYEYRPDREKLPAVILSHAYLANQGMCRNYAVLIAGLGYAAFTYDFNGGGLFSKSNGKSSDMTVETEIQDLKAVIRYVKALPYVDEQNVALLGCSQGGVVSAIVSRDPDYRPAKLILLYPALCIPDDARAGKMMFARFDPQNISDVIQKYPMKLSGDYAKSVQTWSLEDIVGNYVGLVLLLHGTADRIVSVEYARKAVREYPHIEYHEIQGAGHIFHWKHDKQAKMFIADFLKR